MQGYVAFHLYSSLARGAGAGSIWKTSGLWLDNDRAKITTLTFSTDLFLHQLLLQLQIASRGKDIQEEYQAMYEREKHVPACVGRGAAKLKASMWRDLVEVTTIFFDVLVLRALTEVPLRSSDTSISRVTVEQYDLHLMFGRCGRSHTFLWR